jgi:cyanophycin synthetase
VRVFPGLILCGADVAIENATVPATEANHHFIELNHNPGFSAHHSPVAGTPRDVGGAIIDYLMSRR